MTDDLTVYPNERAMKAADKIKATRKRGAGNWLAFIILMAMATGSLIYARGYLDGKHSAVNNAVTVSR